jgi:hypothetical protein
MSFIDRLPLFVALALAGARLVTVEQRRRIRALKMAALAGAAVPAQPPRPARPVRAARRPAPSQG